MTELSMDRISEVAGGTPKTRVICDTCGLDQTYKTQREAIQACVNHMESNPGHQTFVVTPQN